MLSRKDMNMGKAMGGGGGPDAGTAADMLGSMPKPKESARILELRKVHHDLMNNLAAIMFKKKRWDRVVRDNSALSPLPHLLYLFW